MFAKQRLKVSTPHCLAYVVLLLALVACDDSIAPPTDKLYVITSFYMKQHSQMRLQHYKTFEKYMATFPEVEFWTIECVLEGQDFAVTQKDNPRHVQVRAKHYIGFKQNLLNILIKKLPKEAKYVAWPDADVYFCDQNWALQTMKMLETKDVGQLFTVADFLGQKAKADMEIPSFCVMKTDPPKGQKARNYSMVRAGHTGFAWAARMDYIKSLPRGRLFEYNIVDGGDWEMAFYINQNFISAQSVLQSLSSYSQEGKKWMKAAQPKRGFGCLQGVLVHMYHGTWASRRYSQRDGILLRTGYDPLKDLYYNEDGVIQIKEEAVALRKAIEAYGQRHDTEEQFEKPDFKEICGTSYVERKAG